MTVSLEDVQRFAAFRCALRRFEWMTEAAAQKAGLTARQYVLLLAVAGAPDGSGRASIGELAERLHLAQSTITGLVDRAEAARLVERVPGRRDGRVVCVVVTELGRDRLDRALIALDADRAAMAEAGATLRSHLRRR
jgi:DNA-binding MarR family transcriptional regulator